MKKKLNNKRSRKRERDGRSHNQSALFNLPFRWMNQKKCNRIKRNVNASVAKDGTDCRLSQRHPHKVVLIQLSISNTVGFFWWFSRFLMSVWFYDGTYHFISVKREVRTSIKCNKNWPECVTILCWNRSWCGYRAQDNGIHSLYVNCVGKFESFQTDSCTLLLFSVRIFMSLLFIFYMIFMNLPSIASLKNTFWAAFSHTTHTHLQIVSQIELKKQALLQFPFGSAE